MPRKRAALDLGHIAEPLRPLAIPIDSLVLDPVNARRHPERNLEAVAGSLRSFGQRKPVVVRREGMVVEAGNGTLEAARALGWTHIAAVVVDDDRITATRFALADNRTAELAEWDDEVLATLLRELKAEDVDLDGLGWSLDDLEALQDDEPPPEDVAPTEPPVNAQSQRGEVYALGPHRLMCGDSTDPEDVATLLAGDTPTAMILDPPFDLGYDPWEPPPSVRLVMVWLRGHTGLRWLGERVGDPPLWGVSSIAFSGQARGWARPEWPCLVHEVCYVMRRGESRGEKIRGQPCEAHGLRVTVDGRPFSFYEGLASRRNDMRWAKNPACFAPFYCFVGAGGLVYDPCAGSGASLLAAHPSKLLWVGIEMQPQWCDMIRKRWGDYARANDIEPGPDAL